ncbi:hypothetical protein ACFPRL_27445 [Pseudoclavibacter helvolus]
MDQGLVAGDARVSENHRLPAVPGLRVLSAVERRRLQLRSRVQIDRSELRELRRIRRPNDREPGGFPALPALPVVENAISPQGNPRRSRSPPDASRPGHAQPAP